jgi:hypothetical protein
MSVFIGCTARSIMAWSPSFPRVFCSRQEEKLSGVFALTIMHERVFLCAGLVCLLALSAAAEPRAVRVCVVQEKEGLASPPVPGYDASKLGEELSKRKLSDGTPVRGIAVSGKGTKSLDALLERGACDYVVRIWRHENVDDSYVNSPAGLPSPAPMPGGAQPALAHDRYTVDFELRKEGGRKVIARATLPPPTIYAKQGHRLFMPYPLFATRIVAHLKPPQ